MAKVFLEEADIERLESVAEYLRDRLLIRLCYCLGCRVSEVLGLTVQDIDLDHGTITINHLKKRLTIFCPKCNTRLSKSHQFCPGCSISVKETVTRAKEERRIRILPCDPTTLTLLQGYIVRGNTVSQNGKLMLFGMGRYRAYEIIKNCAERAGLPKLMNPKTGKLHYVSPHRLRDAFAVHAVQINDSGDGLRMLQEHLGHESIATTMKYRKVSGEEQREWFDKLWQK